MLTWRREREEDDGGGLDSRTGDKIMCLQKVALLTSNLDSEKYGQGLLRAKRNLFLKMPCAWGMTALDLLPS